MTQSITNYDFANAQGLIDLCKSEGITVAQAMLNREMQIFNKTEEEIITALTHCYDIMKSSAKRAIDGDLVSMGGLLGGEAKKLLKREKPVCGSLISKVSAYAMGVLEVNTSMGLIVAAPTAGSSGVIPGVLVAIQEENEFSDRDMVEALLSSAAIGYIITRNATVSGAEGGCQAEIGSASAMAAGAVAELFGGSPNDVFAAAATAIANILGLVCDPIAGLVEAPCQKRNAMGATNALISAEITLAGVRNHIPFDETVEAMYKVGRSLPFELRESGLGGLAGTKTGKKYTEKIFG